ncbi:MAG: hypothetical protein ACYDBJ_06680 [Aggregatilineales bacterium]
MGLSTSWQRTAGRLARIGAMALLGVASGLAPALAQSAAPTAPATAEATAVRPVIHAQLNGTALDGTASSYCWPQPGQNPCVLVEDPQPTAFVPAKSGDSITFSVDPNVDSPATLSAQLLDDPDASGNPTQIDLNASKNVYIIDPRLPAGAQRIEVQVVYPPAADGNQNYVAYVFGLQVNKSSVAASGTTQATSNAIAAVPTEATSSAVSPQAATPAATASVSPGGTSAPTVAATKVPTKTATKLPTATSSPTATAVPPTDTPTVIPPTDTPTQVPSPTTVPGISVLPSNPNGVIPKLSLTVGGKVFDPVAVTAVLQDAPGALITVTRPLDTNTPLVVATAGSDAQIQFNGPQPVSELITLQNADATKVIAQQPVAVPNTLILYALPTKPGLYTLYVAVQWPQVQATYIFRLQVN